MKLQNKFTLARPIDDVWAFFHDIDAVAECLPGATYDGRNEAGHHAGNMSIKIGPFQSKFEGSAEVIYDDVSRVVNMVGQGIDKRGGNRGKMTMDCRLSDLGGQTEVTVDSNIQMSGTIAQFGRSGIIEEIAKVLISDFVTNAQARMGGGEDTPARPLDAPGDPAGGSSGGSAAAPVPQPEATRPDRKARPVSAGNLLWRTFVGWLKSLFRK